MAENMFAPAAEREAVRQETKTERKLNIPDYTVSKSTFFDHVVSFLIGFVAGFVVLYVFYKILPLSIIGGAVVGIVYIFVAQRKAIKKRLEKLRVQFYDMLEAMSVSMRAGNPVLKAVESAREDLALIYPEDSDIITEMDIIISRFHNAVTMSAAFMDFAERSGLEDIASFASVYATIEGKSSRADEIVRETQQIIADKMQIEMEIETLMTAAKSEVNIMLFMPLIILLVIGYAGAGFMDTIYTTSVGRIIATVGLAIFVVSFILAKRISNVKV